MLSPYSMGTPIGNVRAAPRLLSFLPPSAGSVTPPGRERNGGASVRLSVLLGSKLLILFVPVGTIL